MYDKYSKANTFSLNTKLGSHKGLLLTVASGSSTPSATVYMLNSGGNTGAVTLPLVASTSNVVPIQVYSVLSLSTGVTGWILN
jgi:hypothetical protein